MKRSGFLSVLGLLILLWGLLSFEQAGAQLPDLTVEFNGPATAYPGEDITERIEITVKNTGGTDARSFYVDIILRESTGAEHICARGRVESVVPRKPFRALLSPKSPVLIPDDIQPGKYQLCAVADSTKAVKESREKNNRICHSLTVIGKNL